MRARPGPALPIVISALWAAHLFVLPVQTIAIPGAHGIPLPELVGAAFFAVAVVAATAARHRTPLCIVDAGVVLWVGAVALGAVGTLDEPGAVAAVRHESLAALALGSLYVAIRISATRELLQAFPRWFIRSAVVAGTLAIGAWALALVGIHTPVPTGVSTPYLYLGRASRAQAFLPTASLLASILMMAVFLLVAEWRRLGGAERVAAALVLSFAFVLTFNKSLICLVAGLAIGQAIARFGRRGRSWGAAAVAIWIAAASAYVAVVPWAIVAPRMVESMRHGYMVAGDPVASVAIGGSPYEVLRTNYVYSKLASLVAIEQSWPKGIGPGRHGAFIHELQARGRYPKNLWEADPHCTYLGAAAELGAAGLIGFASLWGAVVYALHRLASVDLPPGLWVAFVSMLAAIAMEAISTDVMNFRQYWWLIGVIAAWNALPCRSHLHH